MNPKLEQQFLVLHNTLVRKYESLNFEVRLFLQLAKHLLNEEFEEENINFDEYRTYMSMLFDMLGKTMDYIGEMMVNIQITTKMVTSCAAVSQNSTHDDSQSTLVAESPNETRMLSIETVNYIQLTTEHFETQNKEPSSHFTAILDNMSNDNQEIKFQEFEQQQTLVSNEIQGANVFNEMLYSLKYYMPNEVLEVYVTHIQNLEYFYGVIYNSQNTTKEPFIWQEKDISEHDFLKSPPHRLNIVLAKFDDGNWYRAQVTDIDQSGNYLYVFFLDYGNRQRVPLKHIAKCADSIACKPPTAQKLRIANVSAIAKERPIIELGTKMMMNMLVNQNIKVSVVSHIEDLAVSFLDEPYSEIPKLLKEMHCVEII